MTRDFGVNQALVEELFLKYSANPSSVSPSWRKYFDALPPEDVPRLTSPGAFLAPAASAGATNGGGGAEVRARNGNGRGPDITGTTLVPFLPPTSEVAPVVPDEMDDDGDGRPSFPPSRDVLLANQLQGRVSALVNAFRVRGHLFADLDPLGLDSKPPTELDLEHYGLANVHEATVFSTGDMACPEETLPLRDIVHRLQDTYCRTIGAEFTFLEDTEQREWLQSRMESTGNHIDLSTDEQIDILTKLTDAELFEQFLHTNYVGAKRFSLEGGEAVIPMLSMMVDKSAELGVDEVVIGMAHRGRLNVLANILGKPIKQIFAGFEDANPEEQLGRGDVKYHLGYSRDHHTKSGRTVHMTLTFNPSHLEFVNPVVEGRVRAKQDRRGDLARKKVLPLVIHGDAAFMGQGIVSETLNLANLDGYTTGGTIHVVINNQIGFTTIPGDSRSSRYCTDITRMLRVPVFHVNGEDPEAVAQVVTLAVEYRQRFQRDVVIDLFCYRKYGHNEGDEPRFTQPVMYDAIDRKKTVRETYVARLAAKGNITEAGAEKIEKDCLQRLENALEETRSGAAPAAPDWMQGVWKDYLGGPDRHNPDVETAVPRERLVELQRRISDLPEGFEANRKVARLLKQRLNAVETGDGFDWGTAEHLAFATLVSEGTSVRFTGQDARRGTFSHRHAVVFDTRDGRPHVPVQAVIADDASFEICDSPLSEQGCLGFEFGYSMDSPDVLVVWEAQFGDFVNGGQVIIDQFIASSEDKWHRLSGLVMLLPHGFEGQGPEHSSARLERFLALCAEDNMQVCNLTTPAQYFHALRRQVHRPWRKPLVIMSPKSLLRHPKARSTIADLADGGFQPVIPDPDVRGKKTRRVLLCTGKVYYDLRVARDEQDDPDVAIVRLEQLYPLRDERLMEVLGDYPKGTEVVWVQEEPWNMGAWYFVDTHLPRILGDRHSLRCVSRPESASPATGSAASHKLEQARLVEEALA